MVTYSPFFVAAIVLGIILLGLRVSQLRLREKTKFEGSKALQRAIRIHANNVEYGAPFAALLIAMDLLGLGSTFVLSAGTAYLAIRLGHGLGFYFGKRGHLLHIVSATANYLLLAGLALVVMVRTWSRVGG
jgi:uncharacterized membrane protein YecN with MAPEG domain